MNITFGAHFVHTILPLYIAWGVGMVAMAAYLNRKEVK